MKNILLTTIILLSSIPMLFAQADIAEARTFAQGTTVTITGTVMNGSSLGIIRYIQDGTAGIPVYDPGVSTDWNQGDNVTITGEIGSFGGAIQVVNTSSATINSSGNTPYAAQVTSPNDMWPDYDAELVQINNVLFTNQGRPFTVGIHQFTQTTNGEVGYIYVRSGHPLLCTATPYGEVNLTGISSAYNAAAQLLPRGLGDIEYVASVFMEESPKQSNITTDGFTMTWEANALATHGIRYGLTPALELGDLPAGTNSMQGSYTFTGFDPATFVYVQTYSMIGGDMVESEVKVVSTASTSTGVIQPYFNNIIDNSVSSGTDAAVLYGPQLLQYYKDMIASAQTSIDVMVYNNNRTDLTQALIDAHNNGITVRYITDSDEFNSALSNISIPFEVFRVQGGTGLMHNKTLVIDAESVDNSWVITGSTNWTDNNINTDFNNTIAVQDQALAKAYTMEFNEMWGSDGAAPGIFAAVAGANKSDNTPHLFNIGGVMVENYFSPSDFVSCRIEDVIRSADSKIDFAVLSFTYNDLGSALVAEHFDNTDVRGFIENINDQGTEYDYLLSSGVDVRDHPAPGTIHHKYVIVDADDPSSDPIVLTGSHNWSVSAETINDENTLIIHDASVANQYWQEFEARWDGLVGIKTVPNIDGFSVATYPNPASDHINLDLKLDNTKDIQVEVFDVNGKPVNTFQLDDIAGQYIHTMKVSQLPVGYYFVAFTIDGLTKVNKIEVVR